MCVCVCAVNDSHINARMYTSEGGEEVIRGATGEIQHISDAEEPYLH